MDDKDRVIEALRNDVAALGKLVQQYSKRAEIEPAFFARLENEHKDYRAMLVEIHNMIADEIDCCYSDSCC